MAQLVPVKSLVLQAAEEIFILDWWLSPELLLKRGKDREFWQLSSLLRRKADQGVQQLSSTNTRPILK